MGINYSGGDESFYRQLLKEIANTPEEKIKLLQKYYDEKDWQNYAIKVHAVKSTTKMVGALEVSDMAKALESAAKKKDETVLERDHAPFMDKYKSLLSVISDREGEEDPPVTEYEEALEFLPADEEDDVLEFAPETYEEEKK